MTEKQNSKPEMPGRTDKDRTSATTKESARPIEDRSTDSPKLAADKSLETGVRDSQRTPVQQEESRPPKPINAKTAVDLLSGRKWLTRTVLQSLAVIAVVGTSFFLLGLAQKTGWLTASGAGNADGSATASNASSNTRYICPMMCTPPSTEPGRCPVCAMELVEATGDSGGDGKSVSIEPAARRLVGIQTEISKLGEVNRTIRTTGTIEFDESRLSTISAYIDGRLEKMFANYVGATVKEGDDLALIYSPQLYTAQTEFVTSLQSKGKVGRFELDNGDLAQVARDNLSELGMTDQQIDALAETGKPQSRTRIKSPQTGTVIEKAAVEGDYLETGQKIFRIADLSTVWLMLDLFPDDASTIRFGQQIEAEIESKPGEVFTGRVAFIDPTVNPKTRTVSVRVEILNFDGQLRPGDYATATVSVPAVPATRVYDPALADKYISPTHPQVIRNAPGDCPLCGMPLVHTSEFGYSAEPLPEQRVVSVPRDAVLMAGHHAVIYVETEPGRFEIRRVTVGPMSKKEAVIVEGLSAGETVATGGNFLIDSQMQLAGNPSLLDPGKASDFPPGPLELPKSNPQLLAGEIGEAFDATYAAYFDIQSAMAADQTPPPVALNHMIEGLRDLEVSAAVPDEAQRRFAAARRAAGRMDGSLETARESYRTVSRALLQAATVARGPMTAQKLVHFHCPMVPGGGGDWMQPGGELANPYWGSEMLRCGEEVRNLSTASLEVPSLDSRIE